MGLRDYRRKRDFTKTAEPSGAEATAKRAGAGLTFVVQRHAARALHHDFRLELDGVLLSWAVPKGPPTARRPKVLAVRTEDHPLQYGTFEGVIPAGEYGGGTVMLWDRGHWQPEKDARRGLVDGKLEFTLDGERLRGRFTLVRMRGKPRERTENWLWLRRSATRKATPRATPLPPSNRSIATGRTMAQIAAGAAVATNVAAKPARKPAARTTRAPTTMQPQLATLVDVPPDGDAWLHEIKLDGYRLLAHRNGRDVRLVTRNGHDWTTRFPTIAAAIRGLAVRDAVLDGEVVVLARNGVSDFQALQNSLDTGDDQRHVFFAFDLLHCDGVDLTQTPLRERKRRLAALLGPRADGPLRYSEHVDGRGDEFHREACAEGLEGIVSKRADGAHAPGRSREWVKTKCLRRQEFVVGGFTAPGGARGGFGSLLLGVHETDGERGLRYAGKVGTGFTAESLAELARRLRKLRRKTSPFAEGPTAVESRGATFVLPELVVEVAFAEWTQDGRLRHPSFQGIRDDKRAADVVREDARTPSRAPAATAPDTSSTDTVAGVVLSNPDRALYPEMGVTKLELARYVEQVAEHLLPHVVDRPMSIVRCPQGRAAKCFFQKHRTQGLDAPVRGIAVTSGGKSAEYIGVDDVAGLVTLVQFGTLEFHPFGSRADRLDRPNRIVVDLDPGDGVPWARVVAAARRLRELLDTLGLVSFARTTGGKGLHVVVPIERRTTWDDAAQFARDLAGRLADEDPDAFVLTSTRAKRKGRIYVDTLRNAYGSTAIASYSPRAREGATVAMPVGWDEVTAKLDPRAFDVRTVPVRLARNGDAWRGFADVRQSLTAKVRDAVRR
jgi:bifunctional non-homologous end joining protein LigD